jgi:glycerate-2-kinase
MIQNTSQLIENIDDASLQRMRHDACIILATALKAVDPQEAILNAVKLDGEYLRFKGGSIDLSKVSRIFVVGGGKAGGLMTRAIESILGKRITDGIVNVIKGTERNFKTSRVEIWGASHPIPCSEGEKGIDKMLDMTNGLTRNDLVITLISGGGSALMPYPASGISLNDLQETTNLILRSGANINELNAVRKHLSGFKGGQFARHVTPAKMLTLILSDVIGDPLDTIASGPTAADDTSFMDARNVLNNYGLLDKVPKNVLNRINAGMNALIPETPKRNDPIFEAVYNLVIANNSIAANSARDTAERLGYNSMVLTTYMEGEARQVGGVYASIAQQEHFRDLPLPKPAAIIIGGETTVTVSGDGKGGRNQEVALSSIHKLSGIKAVIATINTDGIDGPTDASGAIVDGKTLERAELLGLRSEKYLKENNSYIYFERLNDLIFTGPTGTNVNDLSLILIR